MKATPSAAAMAYGTAHGLSFLKRHWAPLIIVALFCSALALYWSGIGPGDGEQYLNAALRWREGAFLGADHWALRHLFVLPIAASFMVFGAGETASIIPNVVYAALTVFVTWHFARRALGQREAFIAASLIATSAFFVARPIELEVYGAEAFFAALAMWLFIEAGESKARARFLVAAGVAAGLASTVREQSVYLMVVFGLIIVAGRRDVFRSLLTIGAGFGAVILVELALYTVAAGDPFYRYKIDLNHREIGFNASMSADEAKLVNRLRRMATYLVTSPMTVTTLAFAATALAYLAQAKPPPKHHGLAALKSFGAAGVISAIIVPLVFNLSAPRYYPLLTYAAFLVIAVAIGTVWTRGRPRAALAAALAIIAVNVAIADFSNYGDYAEARRLAAIAATLPEAIYADPLTAGRARYQMLLGGATRADVSAKVINGRPSEPGVLFLKTARTRQVDPSWCVIAAETARRPKWSHTLIRESGLARLLGRRIERIVAQPEPILLIRTLEQPALIDPVSGRACISHPPA